MKMRWLIIGIIVAGISTPCYAQTDLKQLYGLRNRIALQKFVREMENVTKISDVRRLKTLGIAYHNLATLKVNGASGKAVDYLQKAYSLSSHDNEVLAYLGSAMTMAGRDSWNIFTKMSMVHKGIKKMDEAAASRPDSIVIRMVRANASLNLPDSFKRKETAKKDFQYLEMLITKSTANATPDTEAEIFYQLGMFAKQSGSISKAKEYFRKSINASPDSQWGKQAERSLEP